MSVLPLAQRPRARLHLPIVAALAAMVALPATAGRPLSTDTADTGTTGRCQLESWLDAAGSQRTGVIAGACAPIEGLELGADLALNKPSSPVAGTLGIGAKWAPEHWVVRAPGGTWRLAVAAGAGLQRSPGSRWIGDAVELTGIASTELTRTVSLHLNAGAVRLHQTGERGLTWSAAAVWAARPSLELSAQIAGTSDRAVFGGPSTAVGARWWLQPETLALDLAVSREHTSGAPTVVSIGVGWYGLGYRD